jgi:hypothetical protein
MSYFARPTYDWVKTATVKPLKLIKNDNTKKINEADNDTAEPIQYSMATEPPSPTHTIEFAPDTEEPPIQSSINQLSAQQSRATNDSSEQPQPSINVLVIDNNQEQPHVIRRPPRLFYTKHGFVRKFCFNIYKQLCRSLFYCIYIILVLIWMLFIVGYFN